MGESLIYCDDLEKLGEAIDKIKITDIKPYTKPDCWLDKEVVKFLEAE